MLDISHLGKKLDNHDIEKHPTKAHHEFHNILSNMKHHSIEEEKVHINDKHVHTHPKIDVHPLNTNISFKDHIGLYEEEIKQYEHQLDTNFNWRDILPSDSSIIKKKKKKISKPRNQHMCGSCWAIVTAQCISDNFVVSGIIDWKPDVSASNILACFPQHGCNGGNPATLINDISRSIGTTETNCLDYSWCADHDNCSGRTDMGLKKQEDLNKLIPNCGCYFGNHHKYFYPVEETHGTMNIGHYGLDTPEKFEFVIKNHIFDYGPVIGGFVMFKNFIRGNFNDINGGVYFERGDYSHPLKFKFSDEYTDVSNYMGSHAVSVIGWGIEPNILYDNNKRGDVPYWFCRNSWGNKWADKGYFKIAMYPYNKISQFEKLVKLKLPSGNIEVGSIIMINVKRKPVLKMVDKIEDKYSNIKKIRNNQYYQNNLKIRNNNKSYFLHYITIIILLISIIFIIFRIIK